MSNKDNAGSYFTLTPCVLTADVWTCRNIQIYALLGLQVARFHVVLGPLQIQQCFGFRYFYAGIWVDSTYIGKFGRILCDQTTGPSVDM